MINDDSTLFSEQDELNGSSEYDFERILREAPPMDFVSYKYTREGNKVVNADHMPKLADVVAHLKVMRAFAMMKLNVVEDYPKGEDREKNWQVFMTIAVRRFVIFVSCLKYATGYVEPAGEKEDRRYLAHSMKDHAITSLCGSLLPPLDVLMVWHAFLLNPRSFYDHFMRNDFYKFANLPFPFYAVNAAIDNGTFEYNPENRLKEKYFALLDPFIRGNSSIQTLDLKQYDISRGFNNSKYVVDVACPSCKKTLLSSVPYTTKQKNGFADPNFAWRLTADPCPCGFASVVTHNELRKRQMFSDAKNSAVFPGVYKYFSSVLSHKLHQNRDCHNIDGQIKVIFNSIVLKVLPGIDLKKAISLAVQNKQSSKQMQLILRNYLNMNLIHTTISAPKPQQGKPEMEILEFSEDLVGILVRQERFVQRMNILDWLHSPVIQESIEESIVRYLRFFEMVTKHEHKLLIVPTLDIDPNCNT